MYLYSRDNVDIMKDQEHNHMVNCVIDDCSMCSELRKLENERVDPERNRVGVRGDPQADEDYKV